MAAQKTENYDLPLAVSGHVPMQNSFRAAMGIIDTTMKEIADSVEAVSGEEGSVAEIEERLDDLEAALVTINGRLDALEA